MDFIEKIEEIQQILQGENCFLFPVLKYPTKHYCENQVILLYGFVISSGKEFLAGYGQYDIPEIKWFTGQIKSPFQHLIYKKKWIPEINGIDADLLYWFYNFKPLEIEYNRCIDVLQNRKLTNDLIPVYKWVDVARKIKNQVINLEIPKQINRYDNLIQQLSIIEQNGLTINTDVFHNYFYDTTAITIHCDYNPYTITGRPSNHFSNVNFAALNKTNGCRKSFISRFGKDGYLVEYDFNAFHVNLIAKILGYKFDNIDVYQYFAGIFKCDKEKAKDLVFQQIYGNIRPEYQNLEFFKLLENYIQNVKNESILFKKPMPEIDSKIKLFNYLLQNLETEVNSIILTDITSFLKDKKTKLILYTYDSFLFDYCIEDGNSILKDIKEILENIGIRVSMKKGDNYHTMNLI